jgi:proteasome assembly chaperone (PAC2) family protein
MDHVEWTNHPQLRHPVLLAAFEGWNDAGEAATTALRFLADAWGAEPFAVFDPEEFFDFSSTRPTVRLDDHEQREIVWPSNQLLAASVPGADLDVVLLIGAEPQLRWRTFCQELVEVIRALDVSLAVALGALLADVPHSRPVSIVGTADDPELVRRLDLRRSRYEGPTGIVGVMHDALRRAGMPSVSLWAAVPAYVPASASPKAALALVRRAAELLAVPVRPTELEIASAEYERQINELVAADEDTADYVARLERSADDESEEPGPVSDEPGTLIEELERYLRDQGS